MENHLGQPVGEPLSDPELRKLDLAMPMRGSHCVVTPLAPGDHATDLFEAYAAAPDEGDWTYLPYGPFAAQADFVNWLAVAVEGTDPLFFAITDISSGRAVGLASYLRINDHSASIEVGHIHLSRQLQGTSAATEAMYLMMQRAFSCGYRRYEWKCDSLNAPSRSAATRLGFTFEGIFRQHTHYKGRNRDTAWFAIVDVDWATIDSEFQRWLDPANFDQGGRQLTRLSTSSASK